jgi:hypothetical protein
MSRDRHERVGEVDREQILAVIRRCADEDGGRPPGQMRFETVTGIGPGVWRGRFWIRWSEAIQEAGLEPNEFGTRVTDDDVLASLATLVREIGRFPIDPELRAKRREDPTFPSPSVFDRIGKKPDKIEALRAFCERNDAFADVRDLLPARLVTPDARPDGYASVATQSAGYVYLMKSGRFYKIGRTNAVGRRQYELSIQLPQRLETVHVIETDDALGIERYWHERFADRRANGEWFSLTKADVVAFKRRRGFM